ncbi:retrotransposon protein, putative, ty1-copia subclass [Tanacetum coccineum]|uniref:Retrotransposon protein, putative, ty1-copia subclass n=1 Tax=Tanacetum coccineum TaxID=301880 RepID=A0ABQ4WKU0_9ASTR
MSHVYQKASGSNVTFLILYVDDIIIMGNHIPSLQSVKNYLGKCFAMKDLEEAAFILGIKIYRDRSKRLIGLSQSAYMDKILKRYRMDNSKRSHIPMQERLDLNKTQGASTPEEVKHMQNVPYAWDPLYRDDIKSPTRYVFILNEGAMDWKSSKHSTTAMSATEAEYIDASEAAMKAKGARHYHRRYHYVRECIELDEINLLKVHTDDNLADPFTKALPKGKPTKHARSIGLCLPSSFM